MNKKLENILIWSFLVFSLCAVIYFGVDTYTKINQVEDLRGIYTVVCPNGSVMNFTAEGPKYLCDDVSHRNPTYNFTDEIKYNNIEWQKIR